MEDRRTELGTERIGKLLIRYSTPAMIGMFVNSMYNLVDTIFVGRGAGTLALAGLAVSFPIQMIILSVAMTVGIGTASVVSRNLGSGDQRKAERAAGTSFAAVGIISIIMAIMAYIWLEPLLRLFGASDDVLPYAKQYMSIILMGTFFYCTAVCSNNIVRSEGNARIAMVSMLIGAITNIILDPVFIFGFGMGIRGAAIATVIANICTFAFLMFYFLNGWSMLKITRKDLLPDFTILPEIIKVGSPSFFQMVAGSMMAIPINASILFYGADIHLAIVGVVNRTFMFFTMPIYGLVQGLQPIIGFNYGAGDMDRVREAIRTAARYATMLSVGAFLILMFATELVLSLFSKDLLLLSEGAYITRTLVIAMPFVGFQMVGGSMFQALGKARPALVIAMSRQVLILIPLMILLPRAFGLNGLWAAFPTSDFVAALLAFAWVFWEVRRLDGPLPLKERVVVSEEA